MRIGLVCPYSLSSPGGVQAQVLGLARALQARGHEVSVIAPGEIPPGCVGTSVGRAWDFRVNGSIAPMAPVPAAAVRAVRAARQGNFDVLHLHEPLAPSITIPVLIAKPAPLVATFHAAGHRTPYRWSSRPLRRLSARIDVRVAVSESAAQLARRHLGGAYELLFNGIDVSRYPAPAPARGCGSTILFLGRHEPRKGLDLLLNALSSLPPWVRVRVAGAGPVTDRLRERYRDERVRWLGRLTEEAKVRELRNADVLCAPSRHGESFGMVLLEAMAAGTPVVAADVPGYRCLAGTGDAVHFVPPSDADALAAALLRVLSDPRLAADLRARGTTTVSRYAMDELAARYADIYAGVATSR